MASSLSQSAIESIPMESNSTTVNSLPWASLYFSGTTHSQIPMVSSSNECPTGNTSPWSNTLPRMYDLPVLVLPNIETTHTGPPMDRSFRSAKCTSWSPLHGWLVSFWITPDVSSQLQLFGMHNGIAVMFFLVIRFWLESQPTSIYKAIRTFFPPLHSLVKPRGDWEY